jgi:hypothetical protein
MHVYIQLFTFSIFLIISARCKYSEVISPFQFEFYIMCSTNV